MVLVVVGWVWSWFPRGSLVGLRVARGIGWVWRDSRGVVGVACSYVRNLRLARLPPREERVVERRFVPSMTDKYFGCVGASLRVDSRSCAGSGVFGLRGFDTVRALLYGVSHAGEFNAS